MVALLVLVVMLKTCVSPGTQTPKHPNLKDVDGAKPPQETAEAVSRGPVSQSRCEGASRPLADKRPWRCHKAAALAEIKD